jgi:hypothetical protein
MKTNLALAGILFLGANSINLHAQNSYPKFRFAFALVRNIADNPVFLDNPAVNASLLLNNCHEIGAGIGVTKQQVQNIFYNNHFLFLAGDTLNLYSGFNGYFAQKKTSTPAASVISVGLGLEFTTGLLSARIGAEYGRAFVREENFSPVFKGFNISLGVMF